MDAIYQEIRARAIVSMIGFTKFSFLAQYNRSYIVARHHQMICDALDDVITGKTRKLMINMPPRYGKTQLAVKSLVAYGLALNPSARFLHLSYSDDLAHDNSEEIRGIVSLDLYQYLFPWVRIDKKSNAKKKWVTTAGGGLYATSTGGQVTGFGAGQVDDEELEKELDAIGQTTEKAFGGCVIIDDPQKPDDALSDIKRERVNQRFESTIRNRVNSRNTPFVIIMQRLHQDDLCGYLQRTEPGEWKVLSIPAITRDDDGVECALWEMKHTLDELYHLREINPLIFETQYQQNPMPSEGLLYDKNRWKEYKELPITIRATRKAYIDTADTGSDDLVCIQYVETELGNFITDAYATDEGMEVTQDETARRLDKFGCEVCNVESNNGGHAFALAVESKLRMLGNTICRVDWFHQSQNKQTRINTQSAAVQNMTYWPEGWRSLFPKVASALDNYMKAGKNLHDDIPDALTGTIEKRSAVNINTTDVIPEGEVLTEIHPSINGHFTWCQVVKASDGTITIVDGGLNEPTDILAICKGDVHITTDGAHMSWASDVRKRYGKVWLKKDRPNMEGFIAQYLPVVKKWQMVVSEQSRPFMVNLQQTDSKNVYESALVLCQVAERVTRRI